MTYDIAPAKPVLVIGASGFMGSHIAHQLVAAGRSVRLMLRESSDQRPIQDLSADIVYGNVGDLDSLRTAMRGCASVFYNVVDTRAWLSDPAPLYRCNVDGLVNAMEAALDNGIERFLFTSSIATIGLNPNRPVAETDAFNWHDRAPHYILSRVGAEERFMQYCRDRGLPGITLCVANTYGPGDYQPTPHGKLLWEAANGKVPIALDCGAPTVDIRDAAQAVLLAEQHGQVGERYIIANTYMNQIDLFGMAAAEYGGKPPKRLPLWLAYTMAWLNELRAHITGERDFRLKRDTVLLSEVFKAMNNTKAITTLGWQPRPIEETVRDAVAWYAQQARRHQP